MTAIRALLSAAIDYAGMFPPAGLSLEDAVRKYRGYREGPEAWALGRFVAPVARARDTGLETEALSLVSGAIEHAGEIVYIEARPEELPEVKRKGARAKIRTGGLESRMFPSCAVVAQFLTECARLRIPFKATAGLHHAVRGTYPLTYEPGSESTVMHGFLNVLVAACFAWGGGPVAAVLEEEDVSAFRILADSIAWRDYRLTIDQIVDGRREFVASFGSCSFEEPLNELREFGAL